MRFKILSTISLVLAAATAGCSDDELMYPGQVDDEATGRSPLRFEVNPFSVGTGGTSRSSEPSAIPEPESEEERQIRDFWLFQFKTDGAKIASKYYSIPTDGATLDDLTNKAYTDLAQNTRMTIFVVTNTGDAAWGNGFNSLTEVKNAALPSPFPIQAGLDSDNDGKPDGIYIPMSGQVENVTATGLIEVPVTRAYAKIKIQAGFPDNTMNLYYANVEGIPWYCKVTSLSGEPDADVPAAVPFPEGTRMISRAFNSKQMIIDADNKQWLVLYMPENIRGEVSGIDKNKTPRDSDIPKDALTVTIRAKYDGADYYYKVYPGENTTNNFNIRRNRVYRVTIDVRQIQEQHNPSSNCYVVKPGEKLQFEPYNRDEKGGDYDISTYLDPDVTSKRIAKVGIIWQTKDCIGDNSKGDLVCFEANEQNPQSSKVIIKKTGAEGNALVGAYNSSGKIIWSWHIWVTPNEPDNIANAIIYTTYTWDASGIHTDRRIPGYGIMACNIGALAFESNDDMGGKYSLGLNVKFPDSQIRTFGMLYQWGRKDPFPPVIISTGTEQSTGGKIAYNNTNTEEHYANDNRTEVKKTDQYAERFNDVAKDYLFYSVLGSDQEDPVAYGVQHPTVYMSGTANKNYDSYNQKGGDWCGFKGDDRLWGATSKSGVQTLSVYGGKAHLYDDYGEKSIFDPCPKGWRVAPGDLWLGFTRTGLNPEQGHYDRDVNYDLIKTGYRPGMYMYVQNWQKGPTIYFPLQGTRVYNGEHMNTGLCGNYHNATCDNGNRVDLLHLHRDLTRVSQTLTTMLFKLFEFDYPQYYSKSTAGPIRCVRETK